MTRTLFVSALLTLVACTDPLAPAARLTGRITVEGAAPAELGGLSVLALPSRGGGAATLTTDAEGRFAVDAIAPGEYVLSATVPDTVESTRTASVAVASGASVDAPALAFTGTGTVTGRIADGNGAPILGAQALLGGRPTPVAADGDGRFALTSVPAGAQSVVAYASGRGTAFGYPSVSWRGTSDVGTLVLPIAAHGNVLTGRVLYPGPSGPVPPIRVEVDDGVWQGTADATGVFTIPGVSDGTHSLDFYEETAAPSGAPQPLHNRLPHILFSGGQTFVVGHTLQPLPDIPLLRGRRIGAQKKAQSPDGQWLLVSEAGSLELVGRTGPARSLAPNESCVLLEHGALCSAPNLSEPLYSIITLVPYDQASPTLAVSAHGSLAKTFPDQRRVLLLEPGATSTELAASIVDDLGTRIAFDRAVDRPTAVAIAGSGAYVALIGLDTQLFDSATGVRVNHGCGTGAFSADRFVCRAADGFVELAPNGERRVLSTQPFSPTYISPNGDYAIDVGSGPSDYVSTIIALDDGHVVAQHDGNVSPTWSSDGTRVWLYTWHLGDHRELAEVALPSGATKTIEADVRACRADAKAPALWVCTTKSEEVAIDALSGTRLHLADNPSGAPSFALAAGTSGVGVYTNPPGKIDNGRIDWIDAATLAHATVISGAVVNTYDETPGAMIDAAGRRLMSNVYFGELYVWDRALSQGWNLGAKLQLEKGTHQFAGDDAVIVQRSSPALGLEELAGVYLTEFAP